MRAPISLEPTAPTRIDGLVRRLADFEANRESLAEQLHRLEEILAAGEARRRVVADRLATLKREGRHRECSEVNRELNSLDLGPRMVDVQRVRAEVASLDQRIAEMRQEMTRTPCV